MTTQVNLVVNGIAIPLEDFVAGLMENTVAGMVSSLKGVGEIGSLTLSIEGDNVLLKLNDADVPIIPFVGAVIKNTVFGMVSSLKGVGEINSVDISIKR